MCVPFPFKEKRSKQLEHVIIVSNTIKTSSRFISLIRVPVPFPFPDSGFHVFHTPVVGMHSFYLVVKEFRGCFKRKFWCYIVLLFHFRSHIFASIEKFGSQL